MALVKKTMRRFVVRYKDPMDGATYDREFIFPVGIRPTHAIFRDEILCGYDTDELISVDESSVNVYNVPPPPVPLEDGHVNKLAEVLVEELGPGLREMRDAFRYAARTSTGKIPLIKEIRARLGCGLADAKLLAEMMLPGLAAAERVLAAKK